jgi:hypothetical protein
LQRRGIHGQIEIPNIAMARHHHRNRYRGQQAVIENIVDVGASDIATRSVKWNSFCTQINAHAPGRSALRFATVSAKQICAQQGRPNAVGSQI